MTGTYQLELSLPLPERHNKGSMGSIEAAGAGKTNLLRRKLSTANEPPANRGKTMEKGPDSRVSS